MNLKRILIIAIPLIVIAIIIYVMKVRNDTYYKINPIFHPLKHQNQLLSDQNV